MSQAWLFQASVMFETVCKFMASQQIIILLSYCDFLMKVWFKFCRLSSNNLLEQRTLFFIIHCTHYQHSDWPRAPSLYFKNSHDFVDKHDYFVICYPIIIIICRLYCAQCACVIHLWLKSASTWMVSSDAATWCVFPCIFRSTIKIYLHFTWQFLYIFHKTMYNKTIIEFGFCDINQSINQ